MYWKQPLKLLKLIYNSCQRYKNKHSFSHNVPTKERQDMFASTVTDSERFAEKNDAQRCLVCLLIECGRDKVGRAL